MPTDETGKWFNPPNHYEPASIAPQVLDLASTINWPAFKAGALEDLESSLHPHAFLRTALAGANNDIDWVQLAPGAAAVSISYVNPGNNGVLAIAGSAAAVVVTLATSGVGAITTTAAQLLAALAASPASQYVAGKLATGNDGTGVVTALAATPVADWVATTLDVKLQIDATGDGDFYDSPDGAFAQVAGVAGVGQDRAFGGMGESARWVTTVGGVTHIAAFSIVSERRTS